MNMIQKVADAIREAEAGDNYRLFDYFNYLGTDAPHVVKDGYKELFRSWDAKEAKDYYYKLKNNRVAKAAIEAMREPSEKMIEAADKGSQFPPYILDTKGKYQAIIDEALKE